MLKYKFFVNILEHQKGLEKNNTKNFLKKCYSPRQKIEIKCF